MDLGKFVDVARRHRRLVVGGVAVTLALALFSYVRISPSGITYRASPTWANSSTLILSQPGFPEYRAATPGGESPNLAGLTDVYAALVTSDEVLSRLVSQELLTEEEISSGEMPITASPVPSALNSLAPTPLLNISASGSSPERATRLADGAAAAFIVAVGERQRAAGIPEKQRIRVRVLKRAGQAELVAPRSKATVLLVLFAGLTMTFAAASIRENVARTKGEQPGREEIEAGGQLIRKHGSTAALASTVVSEEDRITEAPEPRSRWSAHSTG